MKRYPLTVETLNALSKGVYALFKNGILKEVIHLDDNPKYKVSGSIGSDEAATAEQYIGDIDSCYADGKWEIMLASEVTIELLGYKAVIDNMHQYGNGSGGKNGW